MFQATNLFDKDGNLASEDVKVIAASILEAKAKASFSSHEAKLMRLEIGLAIMEVAINSEGNPGLTETISRMGLVDDLDRANNTFLKYTRVASHASLLQLAIDPRISFSVLDEIAASKKPIDGLAKKEYIQSVCAEVTDMCQGDGVAGDGPTRNSVVGVIRRQQVEFEVPTKAGGKDRDEVKRRAELKLLAKQARLTSHYRLLFLNETMRDEWLEREGMTIADLSASIVSLQNEMIDDGILLREPMKLTKHHLSPRFIRVSSGETETFTEEEEKADKEAASAVA